MHRFKTREGICILLAALVFAACLAVTVGNYAAYGEHNLDSDMSSEFVLAQLLNEEGRLITDSWYYSTEIRLVSPLPIYQLTLALFDSWHVARTVSIAILLVLMALSLLYLARGVGCSASSALLCASAIILPLTKYQAFVLNYGGFYTVWCIAVFLLIGLVVRMDRGRLREPVLILLLGFACGMGGVRMLMICAAPLLAACVLMFYLSLRGCDSLRAVAARPASRIAMGGVLAAAAIFAGYLVNAKVLAQHYHFKNYGVTSLLPLDMNQLGNHIVLLFRFLGYRLGSVLFSRDGIASMLAFDPDANLGENQVNMSNALETVSTGSITFAARDSDYDGHEIHEGELLALDNGKLSFTDTDLARTCSKLVKQMLERDSSFVTVYYGEDVTPEMAAQAEEAIRQRLPEDVELTVLDGGQPVYYFIISVE